MDTEDKGAGPRFRIVAADAPNDKFQHFAQTRTITIPRQPLLSSQDIIFTMGSCFAEEIRTALTARGQACVPRYRRIAFDPTMALVDTVPKIEHMNFYNTFAIRQQFEQMFGLWTQEPDDYWVVQRFPPKIVSWTKRPNYQDPYRRLVIAQSPEMLWTMVTRIVDEMRRAFEEATAFIFTFGMTEVFINRRSGRVAAQKPGYAGGGGLEEATRHDSTFGENLENVRSLIRMIRARKPGAPIIMSVSPVPLARTFGPLDIVTASFEGKSILRAVLGQVVREFEGVAYLPSYEYVTMLGETGQRDDLRHVHKETVATIVAAFFDAFSKVKDVRSPG
jgi:hypothetical protein